MPLERFQDQRPAERRTHPRYEGDRLSARLRPKGKINQIQVDVIDFNRHGLSIRLSQPLPKEQLVFLTLESGAVTIERVIGVVHNCLATGEDYRCGVRFRTESSLQFDRVLAESQLAALEAELETPAR